MKEARHKITHIIKFHFYETSRIGKLMETENSFGVRERGKLGVIANKYRVSFGGDANVLKLDNDGDQNTLLSQSSEGMSGKWSKPGRTIFFLGQDWFGSSHAIQFFPIRCKRR